MKVLASAGPLPSGGTVGCWPFPVLRTEAWGLWASSQGTRRVPLALQEQTRGRLLRDLVLRPLLGPGMGFPRRESWLLSESKHPPQGCRGLLWTANSILLDKTSNWGNHSSGCHHWHCKNTLPLTVEKEEKLAAPQTKEGLVVGVEPLTLCKGHRVEQGVNSG